MRRLLHEEVCGSAERVIGILVLGRRKIFRRVHESIGDGVGMEVTVNGDEGEVAVAVGVLAGRAMRAVRGCGSGDPFTGSLAADFRSRGSAPGDQWAGEGEEQECDGRFMHEVVPPRYLPAAAAEFSQHAAQVLQVLSAEQVLNSAESLRLKLKICGNLEELAIPGCSEYISGCR